MPKFSVAESIEIEASPERVFDVVSDFSTWTTWSPWLCAEPEATVEVTDDPKSVGSGYSWNGEIVGQGEMKHMVLEPSVRIVEDLRLLKPWKSQADVAFDFEKLSAGTKLTWSMDSSMPWFMFWMIPTMKSMIGMDYERGLKMLKEYIETGSVLSETRVRGVESVGPINVAGKRHQCTLDTLGPLMSEAIDKSAKVLQQHNVQICGEKIAVYHNFDMKTRTFDFTAGHIVSDPVSGIDSLSVWSLPRGEALAVEHTGSYDNLGNSWSAAYQHARYKKLKQSKVGTFEIYKNDPETTSVADLKTEVFLPLK